METSFCKYSFIHTPGHSEGSICILIDNILFAVDTVSINSIGRTDLYGGEYEELIKTKKKIKKLSPDTIICPGHGPFTTLKDELKNNMYFNQ